MTPLVVLDGWQLFAPVVVAILGMTGFDLGIAWVTRGADESTSEAPNDYR